MRKAFYWYSLASIHIFKGDPMNHSRDFNPNLPAIVLGGGGTFGMGVEAGYLDEFKERGADFRDAQIIGTSAGSWVGGFVAKQKTFHEITSKVKKVKAPNREPNYLRDIAREIFDDERASNVTAMAVRMPMRRGELPRMEMLNGGEYDLADIVAASSSVPGLFAKHRINDRYYYDGGMRSMASVNLAPKSHKLLAIAALGGNLGEDIRFQIGRHKVSPGPFGKVAGYALEKWFEFEMGQWKRHHGGELVFIRPNKEINALVSDWRDCFSVEVGKRAYELARYHAAELIDRRESIARLVEEMRPPSAA